MVTIMDNMKGYKVVNYNLWQSLPEIFAKIRDAKVAKKKWVLGDGAVIEYFNQKNRRAKVMVEKHDRR